MRRTNYGRCIVCGEGWAKTKGMCGRHYQQHKDGRGDFTHLIAIWELSQQHTKGLLEYRAAVKGIVKGIPVGKKTKEAFVERFLDLYEGGN